MSPIHKLFEIESILLMSGASVPDVATISSNLLINILEESCRSFISADRSINKFGSYKLRLITKTIKIKFVGDGYPKNYVALGDLTLENAILENILLG